MMIVNTDEKTILELFKNTGLHQKYRVEKMREKLEFLLILPQIEVII